MGYDPHLGSFITPDPAMDGLNRYNYANSNPIKYTDPTGLFPVLLAIGIVAVLIVSSFVSHETQNQNNNTNQNSNDIEDNSTLAGNISDSANNNLGQDYVSGQNDCDTWTQNVLEEAGVNITETWGDAHTNTVADHIDNLGDDVQQNADESWNIFFQSETHTGLVDVNGDGVDVYHNGFNGNNDWGSRSFHYDDINDFINGWGGTFSFYPIITNNNNQSPPAPTTPLTPPIPPTPNTTPTPPPAPTTPNNTTNNNGGSGGSNSNNSSSGTVICTELFRQGLLDDLTYKADAKFGKYLNERHPEVITGYHFWAKPVVRLMQRSKVVTKIVYFIAKPWSDEMAYQMGIRKNGSFIGKIVMIIGIPICHIIGIVISNSLLHNIINFIVIISIIFILVGILYYFRFKKRKIQFIKLKTFYKFR